MAHVKVCELRSVAKGGGSGLDGRGGSGQGPFFFFLLLHHKGLNPTALGFCTCDTPYLVLTRKKTAYPFFIRPAAQLSTIPRSGAPGHKMCMQYLVLFFLWSNRNSPAMQHNQCNAHAGPGVVHVDLVWV